MHTEEYINLIRVFLHDPEGKVFDDAELTNMLETAAQTYCKDTALYRGTFSFLVDENGACEAPKDYIEFIAGWNEDGRHIEAISTDELREQYGPYLQIKGTANFIFEDFESIGGLRLCPNPYDLQHVVLFVPAEPYGIMLFDDYGTPVTRGGYGIPVTIRKYDNIGDASYVRSVPSNLIHDYMALVYHAVYQAYTIDSDFQDLDKAQLYYSQYRGRVAKTGQIMRSVSRVRRDGKFF